MYIGIIVVLVLCLLIVPVYFRTGSFYSKNGVLLFTLALSALFLRIFLFNTYPLIATLQIDTFILSWLIVGVPLLLFVAFAFIKKGAVLKKRRLYFMRLFGLYIFFGALQQLFFLTVFTDSLYYFVHNPIITCIVSVGFFYIFHLNWSNDRKIFRVYLLGFAILNTCVYLLLKNMLPQMMLHGLVASVFYTAFSKNDELKNRLS